MEMNVREFLTQFEMEFLYSNNILSPNTGSGKNVLQGKCVNQIIELMKKKDVDKIFFLENDECKWYLDIHGNYNNLYTKIEYQRGNIKDLQDLGVVFSKANRYINPYFRSKEDIKIDQMDNEKINETDGVLLAGIKRIELKNFKKFKDIGIDLKTEGITLVAGGNNSGKTTLLHALAVWQFCKNILIISKGRESLFDKYTGQGVGVSKDEFLPITLPNLNHLWTNLKVGIDREDKTQLDGYNLKIKCFWNDNKDIEKILEISLSLSNDRLFIKNTNSNLVRGDKIPNVAYLPTFAGITDKETRMLKIVRQQQIGKGLAGSVLRNTLLDMYIRNQKIRSDSKNGKGRIKDKALEMIRKTDPWELLQNAVRETFGSELVVDVFNELYNLYIDIKVHKVEFKNNRFIPLNGYRKRDIMVEGSGFLQWLSVYSLALDEEINVLLLDEPDAHLHSSLQVGLINKLREVALSKKKQILITTHSTEIIKNIELEDILEIKKNKCKYLKETKQKIGLLAGLGTEYAPKINKLQRTKKLLIVENESDAKFLEIWCNKLGLKWPNDLVIWPTTANQKERKYLYFSLKEEIPNIKAISLRDRDEESKDTVSEQLIDKSETNSDNNIKYMKWRRRYIENYMMCPEALMRASGKDKEVIIEFLSEHSLSINTDEFVKSDVNSSLCEVEGKSVISEGPTSFKSKFSCKKYDIVKAMYKDEICEDIEIVINTIINHFS